MTKPIFDENINHLPVLVDRPPQITPLTLDSHQQFIQVPRVTSAPLSSPEFRVHSVPDFRQHRRMFVPPRSQAILPAAAVLGENSVALLNEWWNL